MESTTATQTPRHDTVSLATSKPPQAGRAAKRRGAVLARMLCSGDSLAAVLAATIAVFSLGAGASPGEQIAYIVFSGLIWPLAAFSIGLYRGDQLAAWASAVSEVPRAVVALLLITWSLFGIASLLQLDQVVALTFLTVAAIAFFAGLARTSVRAGLHRAPELRQRTLILGSGVVAGQVVDKLKANAQFGLVPVGIVDDDVHDVGTPDLPWLGRFDDLDTIIETQQIDRVIIAFSRASHEQLLESIRACRDAGVMIDIVPRLFEFLDGVRSLDQVGGLPLLSIGAAHLTSISIAGQARPRRNRLAGSDPPAVAADDRDRDRDQARVARACLLPPAARRRAVAPASN